MNEYIKQGLCPCGCMQPVPNGRYWATDRCARRMNKKGVTMPHRYEEKRSKYRGKGRIYTGMSRAESEHFRRVVNSL